MSTILRDVALLALVAVSASSIASEGADGRARELQAQTLTVSDPLLAPFLKPPTFTQMALSPDGKHAAGVAINPLGTNSAVIMIDTATAEARTIVQPRVWKVTGYQPYVRDPRTVRWLNNEQIAVNFTVADAAIFGVDGKPGTDLMQGYLHPLRDAPGKPTDWHLVVREARGHRLSAVNVRTNESVSYDLDLPDNLMDWATDATGQIRAARTIDTAFWSDTSTVTTWYRADAKSKWQKVDERSVLAEVFRPVFVPDRPNRLVVQARNGSDRLAIWDYDVPGRTFDELLAGHESEDIVSLRFDNPEATELQSAVTDGLKRHTYWFDTHYARIQASLDASLPDNVNVLQGGSRNHQLVFSYSDVDPGRWFALDATTMKMSLIASREPSIDPARMQPMQALRYPSSDGTSIPAYLTLPGKPAGPAPLIVLIHGGPQARDYWGFDPEVQIFAAHGYAVFQPQFRGSTGFGKHFEESGYGQWGLAMQDDITAGVHWLIDQKIADPQRICIVGASYGGYAALWGLAKTPDLYKCGVSVAGPSDLGRMLADRSDMSRNAIAREIVRHQLGDPSKMAAEMEAVSPVKHADRITAPLLLVYGKLDQRVPISHGRRMLDAMQDLHKDVQWIEFSDEGHGVRLRQNRVVYYDAVFALLARTIGKGEPPFPPPVAQTATPPASAPQ